MAIGLAGKLNVLRESPLDHLPPEAVAPAAERAESPAESWVASRFNIHSTTDDGRLIVWNTFKGSMAIFRADQRSRVKSLLTRRGFSGELEGLSAYLRDQGFLIKAGTDEYRIFQHAFGHQHYRQDILELILLASEDCNFRCEYCYEDFARGTMKPQVRDAVKRLVQSRISSGVRYLSISWFGGEPLYGWQAIEDLAPFFRSIATENAVAFRSVMTTNGYLLTPDVAEKLLSWGVLRYQITMDGTREHHDRSRPGRNGEPTFDVIFDNLKSLKRFSEKFTIDVRINFDRQNRSSIEELIALLGSEFGGDARYRVLLRPVGRWGGSNDGNLDVCGMEETQETKHEMVGVALAHGLGNADDVRQQKSFGSQVCYAARPYNFIIGADGLVMKCTVDLDKRDRNIVGLLGEDGTLHLNEDKVALWTEPAYAADPGCQKCVVLPLCQGISCPLIRFDENRSPCVPVRHGAKRGLVMADQARAAWQAQR